MNVVVDCPTSSPALSPTTSSPSPTSSSTSNSTNSSSPSTASSSFSQLPTTDTSLAQLEARSFAVRERLVAEKQEQKGTGAAYERHYRAYQSWWHDDQARLQAENSMYTPIPALPVTIPKVVVFLEYEMGRPQKRKLADGSLSTSTCGHQHAKQVVSALEHYRLINQHKYRDVPEAQMNLRSDSRIKAMEKAFEASEPERVKKAHSLKAVGTCADTFVDTELVKMSLAKLFETKKGKAAMWRGHRDRAMTLATCSAALRGDSVRSILWSDLGFYDHPMLAKGAGAKVKALIVRADQSKVNTTGRVDEHGVFRHVDVAVPVPDFAPDFDDPDYGEYGRRQWYDFLFSSAQDCTKEMVYHSPLQCQKHVPRARHQHFQGYPRRPRLHSKECARERASQSEVKALGCWSDAGSYRPCYDRALPIEAVLASAGFDGKRPESHFLAREQLQPPEDVLNAIFDFAEPELEKLAERRRENRQTEDYALKQFLEMLIWLRTVLVQDAAVLYADHSDAAFFNSPPFHSPSFRTFAQTSRAVIKKAEADAALQLKNLPQHIARTFGGMVTQLNMEQRLYHENNTAKTDKILLSYRILRTTVPLDAPQSVVRFSIPNPCRSPMNLMESISLHQYRTTHNKYEMFTTHTAPGFLSESLPTSPQLVQTLMDFDFNLDLASLPQPAVDPQWSPEQQTALAFLNSTIQPPTANTPSGSVPTQLLPQLCHHYRTPSTIIDIWMEYSAGSDGSLCVRDLEEGWGSDWRRANRGMGTSTAVGQRFGNSLSSYLQKELGTELALRFIRQHYQTWRCGKQTAFSHSPQLLRLAAEEG
ncbi:hypothetical protein GGX14DRAFT_409316 [Mycena pura]|uniref:Ndc10 domain-containing protein n=1 Tax=Mycena pura TaxID=153505 RepID=A0AAD6UJD3_9AGAR|nr:hypothetical protein GGX14DRAFT_409316 [Mycena pura]